MIDDFGLVAVNDLLFRICGSPVLAPCGAQRTRSWLAFEVCLSVVLRFASGSKHSAVGARHSAVTCQASVAPQGAAAECTLGATSESAQLAAIDTAIAPAILRATLVNAAPILAASHPTLTRLVSRWL